MKYCMRSAAVIGLALVALTVTPAVAKALMVAPAPTGFRALNAEVVIVGKVTSIEEKTSKSKKDGQEYAVAIVKIEQNLKGMKDTTHVRVAWVAPQKPQVQPNPIPGEPIIGRPFPRPRGGFVLQKDQEVLLFLNKHADENFYIGSEFFAAVGKENNPNFKNELADVVRTIKVSDNPLAALKSKDAEERLLAVAIQLQKYNRQRTGTEKQVPIDATESKLILQAIATADWTPGSPRQPGAYMTNPQNLFYQLRATPTDGWTQPKNIKEFPAVAKKWLTDNADKFVIKRFVEEKAQDK